MARFDFPDYRVGKQLPEGSAPGLQEIKDKVEAAMNHPLAAQPPVAHFAGALARVKPRRVMHCS